MEYLEDCSDTRLRGWCIHCGKLPGDGRFSRDHVPSKCLLVKGKSRHLPSVDVCQTCNNMFAKDEEYLATLLATVISGSTQPDPNRFPSAAKSLARSSRLRKRLDSSRREQTSPMGTREIVWFPELDRVERVLVKNARGHVLYETGQAITEPTSYVGIQPIQSLSEEQRLNNSKYRQTCRCGLKSVADQCSARLSICL